MQRCAAVLLLGVLAVPAMAQQKPPTEPQPSDLQEEVDVRLIELSILARDKQREPVTDLAAEDVFVKVAGEKLDVAYLERVRDELSAENAELAEKVRVRLDVPGASAEALARDGGRAHYTILFIDVENDEMLVRPMAASQLTQFVVQQLGPNDMLAVMSWDGELHLETTFTNDSAAISEAIARAYSREARAGIRTETRVEQLLGRMEDCSRQRYRGRALTMCLRSLLTNHIEEVLPAIREYLETLEGLVRYAGSLQQKVTLIAVTHGMAVRPETEFLESAQALYGYGTEVNRLRPAALTQTATLRRRFEEVIRSALREGVTLYVLDRSRRPTAEGSAAQSRSFQPGARPQKAAYEQAQMDMRELAVSTGGTLITNTNLLQATERAWNLERARYRLGFYSPVPLSREDLSSIKVVPRRKGLRIETGRGSYAEAASAEEIAGGVRWGDPDRLSEDGLFRIPFEITADPRQLGYEPAGGEMAAGITAHVVVQTQAGEPVAEVFHFFTHAYPLDAWKAEQEQPLTLPGHIAAPPGNWRLVAKLENPRTGVGGTVADLVEIDASRARGEGRAGLGEQRREDE
jgi:VWFA-related protein